MAVDYIKSACFLAIFDYQNWKCDDTLFLIDKEMTSANFMKDANLIGRTPFRTEKSVRVREVSALQR